MRVRGHGWDRCGQESHLVGVAYKMELMGWEGEGLRLADVSGDHSCYWHSCHLWSSFHPSAGIDRGSPLLCNMSQMMDPLLQGMCGHTHADTYKRNTWTNTLSLWTHTHTLAHISAQCCRCCHLPFGSVSVAFPNLPTYYFTRPQLAEEISSWAANGILTCKSHVGLNPPAERALLRPSFRCWHHPPTATRDLWAM